jgi:hypothetical protein
MTVNLSVFMVCVGQMDPVEEKPDHELKGNKLKNFRIDVNKQP